MKRTKRYEYNRNLSTLLKDHTFLLTTFRPQLSISGALAPAAKEVVGCDILGGAADMY
jgi:hypothetical protein